MAITDKKRYVVYLDEEETEYVKAFLDTTMNKGGLSGVVNGFVHSMARTLKASGYKVGHKVTAKQMIKIAIKGFLESPA